MSSKLPKRRRDKPASSGSAASQAFGQQLRGLYLDVLSEPVPPRLLRLIDTMRETEATKKK